MNISNFNKCLIGLSTITGALVPANLSAQNIKTHEKKGKQPNILFIAIDDMRPVLSIYGDKMAHTPNFERLAKSGVTFTSNYCQMALSGPTRASLLTGLRPDQIGVWSLQGNFRVNNPDAVSLPELLMKNGYETMGVGKIYHPLDNLKYRNDPQSWSVPYTKTPAATYMLAEGRKATECADVPDDAYEDGIIAERGVEMIQKMAKADKPFFVAVGFKKPHAPYVAPKKYWDMYDREKMPVAPFQDMSSDPVVYAYHASNEIKVYSDIPPFHSYEDTKHLDVATQKRVIHAYYACVSYIDAQLGKLLDALEQQGIADNTVIILWSDHGYHLGDHGLWNKTSNFEGATRTVMLMSVPGMKRDVYSKSISEYVDIYPTICELAGVTPPSFIDGKSLVPVLKNPAAKVNKYAYGQYNRGKINGYSCRNERYRLVEWVDNFKTYVPFDEKKVVGVELYDYTTDPLETKNVANKPEYKKIVEQMRKDLHQHYKEQYEKSKLFKISRLFPVDKETGESDDDA